MFVCKFVYLNGQRLFRASEWNAALQPTYSTNTYYPQCTRGHPSPCPPVPSSLLARYRDQTCGIHSTHPYVIAQSGPRLQRRYYIRIYNISAHTSTYISLCSPRPISPSPLAHAQPRRRHQPCLDHPRRHHRPPQLSPSPRAASTSPMPRPRRQGPPARPAHRRHAMGRAP